MLVRVLAAQMDRQSLHRIHMSTALDKVKDFRAPLEIISMASAPLIDLSVKRARNRLWRGTSAEVLSKHASRAWSCASDVCIMFYESVSGSLIESGNFRSSIPATTVPCTHAQIKACYRRSAQFSLCFPQFTQCSRTVSLTKVSKKTREQKNALLAEVRFAQLLFALTEPIAI
jgi:hypothetical protein